MNKRQYFIWWPVQFILGFMFIFISGMAKAQTRSCQDIFLLNDENHFLTYELYRKWQNQQQEHPFLSEEEEQRVLSYAEKELLSRGIRWTKFVPNRDPNSLPWIELSTEGMHPLNQLAKALSEVHWAGGSRMMISLDPGIHQKAKRLFGKTYLYSETASNWEIYLPWDVVQTDLRFDPIYLRSLRWLESQKPVFFFQAIPWGEMLWQATGDGMFQGQTLLKEVIELEAMMLEQLRGARDLDLASSDLNALPLESLDGQTFSRIQFLKNKIGSLQSAVVSHRQDLNEQFERVLTEINRGSQGLRWMMTKDFEKEILNISAPEKFLKQKKSSSKLIHGKSKKESLLEKNKEIVFGQARPYGENHFGVVNFRLPSRRLLSERFGLLGEADTSSFEADAAAKMELRGSAEALLQKFRKLYGQVLYLQSLWREPGLTDIFSFYHMQGLIYRSSKELQGYPYLWEKTYESFSQKRSK